MPVIPDVVVGYDKPKRKARPKPKAKAKPRAKAKPAARPSPIRPDVTIGYDKPKPSPNTVRVKPRGAKHATTVDTGNILQGKNVPPPARAAKPKRLSFGQALREELEGKGAIADVSKRAAEAVGRGAVIVSGGGGPNIAARVGSGQGLKRRKNTSRTAAILAPKAVKAPKGLVRFGEDIVNLPATVIPSAYVPAAAIREALPKAVGGRGDTSRAKKFIHDVKETDPVVALATGHPKKALKLAEEHPGFAAVEAAGVAGAAGRLAGRAVRGTGKVVRTVAPERGERIRRVGAVETRPNAITPHTAHEVHRAYSPDLAHKAVQVANDRRKTKAAARKRAEADRMQDVDSQRAIELRSHANQLDPRVASTKQIKARENLREQTGETLRKDAVHEIDVKARNIIKAHDDKGGAAPVLVTSGVTRATVADLRSYRGELERAYKNLADPGKRADNVALRRAIDSSLQRAGKKGDPDLRDIAAAAERYHHEIDVPLDRQLNELGILARERGERAKLIPMAAREIGATRQHIDPLADAERAARNELRAAKRQRRAAGKRATRQTERAAVAQGRAEILANRTKQPTAPIVGEPSVRLVKAGEKTYKAKLPEREAFIAARPKANVADTPELAKLVENVKPGPPGISIQGEHVRVRDRITKEPVDFGRELPGSKVVVKRDAQGKPIGALHMLLDEDGKPTQLSVAVDPSQRGKGIGSSLIQAAHDAGFDLRHAENAYTEAGAALKHKALGEHAPSLTAVRYTSKRVAGKREPVQTKPVATMRKLERERGKSLYADRQVERASQRVSAAKATHRDVKVARRAARGPHIVDREGNPIPTAELQELAAERRPVPPSYVSQSPKARGPVAYYRTAKKEPTIDARARTEKPTIEGTFNAEPEALRARAMNAQGLVSAAKNFRAGVAEMGYRGKDGTVKTDLSAGEADQLIANLRASEGTQWVKVEAEPWAADREHIEALTEAVNDPGLDLDPRELEAFHKSMLGAYDLEHRLKGRGSFAIIPKAAAKQRVDFLNTLNPSGIERGARALRSSFTRTVLTTSPGPTVGNILEPAVRATIQKAGPVSAYRAHGAMRALKKIDPEAHRELRAVIGRGRITLAAKRHYVDATQYNEGTTRNLVAGWQAFKNAKGGKQLTAAWDLWTKVVFEQVNGRVEAFFREGPMLGKVLRDSGLMDHTLMGLSSKAFKQAAEGMRNTPEQGYLAVKLNDAYGKYGGFSPDGKRIIQDFTPFAAWWLSAATFIGKVLPRDHPALVALATSTVRATEEWRKAQGLDLFQGEGRQPGWLQGTINAGSFGRVKAAYNTPFGAASDPAATAGNLLLPQVESFRKALDGMDWKDKKLRNDDGTEYNDIQKALYGAGEMLKSSVPAIAVPVRAYRYATKPGTLLNPARIPPGTGSSSTTTTTTSPDGADGVDWSTPDASDVDPDGVDWSTP